ncbi:ethanolamine ammonia-lyase light chain EutC, partial [Azospirillum argentinense]|uniref:ethanolamine ammonia-lyase light chain EutC n=1 Tax=Azospirillum argentinense TaxID=2970906 RepID=UPI001FFE3991
MTESEPVPLPSPAQPAPAQPDRWAHLRRHTDARIALGHAGSGLPTAAHLAFQAAHPHARHAAPPPKRTRGRQGKVVGPVGRRIVKKQTNS